MTDEMAQNLLVLEKLHSYFLICFLVMATVGSIIILLSLIYFFRSNYHSKSNGKVKISETKNRLPDDLTREEFLLKSTNKKIGMKTEQNSRIIDK